MKKLLLLLSALALCPGKQYAQLTQTIYGQVTYQSTQEPVINATIQLEHNLRIGALTDASGNYKLTGVPVGERARLICSYGGAKIYSEAEYVSSAKAVRIDFAIAPQELSMDTTEIRAGRISALETTNQDIIVSGTSFSQENALIEPGNANDPSRMVQSVPGVQAVRDDNADIIIRGNAPMGLLWRLEGIDIPNPNHFARKGNTGGGITMFSTQLLGKSDFSTGAFAPEYGNALSGVFDMHFRKGNNANRETRLRAGLLGLDVAVEGPFNAKDSIDDSYIINYRYSTLGILNQLGYRLLNPRINNTFQDLSFHAFIPSQDYRNQVSVFGIGGISDELWDEVSPLEDRRTNRTVREFQTRMGTFGVVYQRLLSSDAFVRTTTAVMASRVRDDDDTLNIRGGTLAPAPFERELYDNFRIANHTYYQKSLPTNSNSLIFKGGLISTFIQYGVNHELWQYTSTDEGALQTLLTGEGQTFQFQPYAQLRYTSSRLSLTGGVHAVYLTLNHTASIEPRLALRYQVAENDYLTAAYGLHSRVLPLGNYFTQIEGANGELSFPNMDLPMMKAHHAVVGYEHLWREANLRLRVEGYYQALYDVPVHLEDSSFYWHLNRRDGYLTQAASADGTGTNMGIDVSLQKALSNGYFFSVSGSFFDSRYQTPRLEGEAFNTRYNAQAAATVMAGVEQKVGDRGRLIVSTRFIYSGGLKYTPGDSIASALAGQPIFDPLTAFSASQGTYFRSDLRVTYRISTKKAAYQLALDVQNLTNRQTNVREEEWDESINGFNFIYQSGLIPVISFIADF